MKKLIFFSVALCLSFFSFGQTEKLNQLDEKGKKHGKWVVYLDENWDKLKDSTKAVSYRYNYYDHGTSLYPMGPCGKKGYKLEVTIPPGSTPNKFLNGEYKWYDKKGGLSSVHVLKDGHYVSCKEYYPTGELNQHFDYTKKCKGETHGWGVFIYDKTGKLIMTSWMCRDKDGVWPATKG